MEKTPSIKNVSPASLEQAIAKALQELTGWPAVKVVLNGTQYPQQLSGECVNIQLQAWLTHDSQDEELPF